MIVPNLHLFHYIPLFVEILFLIDTVDLRPLAQEHNNGIKHRLTANIYVNADAQITVGRGLI
jgi:hypothetical protein